MIYTYSYAAHPDPRSPQWNRAAFELFRHAIIRTEDQYTEREFNDFREELSKCGIELCEIERWEYHEPENVP